MARRFVASNGDWLSFSAGEMSTNDGGPLSILCLWKPNATTPQWLLQTLDSGGFQVVSLNPYDSHVWCTYGATFAQTLAYLTAEGWRLDVWCKPNGSAPVRYHSMVMSAGTWSHADTSGSLPDAGGQMSVVNIGHSTIDGSYLTADIAVIGLVGATFTDGQIESAGLNAGISGWLDLIGSNPSTLLPFNQANATDEVVDLTGTSTQTSRTGTQIVSGPDGFSYAIGPVGTLALTAPAPAASLVAAATIAGTLALTAPAPASNLAASAGLQGTLALAPHAPAVTLAGSVSTGAGTVPPALAAGRRAAERLMVDRCTVSRIISVHTDRETGVVTPNRVVVYEGRCKVQQGNASGQRVLTGSLVKVVQRPDVHFPIESSDEITEGDEVVVTFAGSDSGVLGKYTVKDVPFRSMATARRIGVERAT